MIPDWIGPFMWGWAFGVAWTLVIAIYAFKARQFKQQGDRKD